MRHFSKLDEETCVSRIELGNGTTRLTREDLRKIDRQVMNTRGDMLFARVLVFFEGETEEQALPDFAEKHWNGKHPNDLGYSFIGVDGHGNYLPFLRLAESFRIPWFIFSDGEPDVIKSVNNALIAIGQSEIPKNPRVVVVPNGKDFEACLATDANRSALIDAIIKHESKNENHKAALKKEWESKVAGEQLESIVDKLHSNKTPYGSIVGKLLPVPPELVSIFSKITAETTVPVITEVKA
jgi:putative ATP-dependent endonuclease of OLD family